MTDISSSVPANAVLLIDRFVSASSAQDAVESLEGMIGGFKSEEEPWENDWILNNMDMLDHLTHLLQHGTLKNGDLPCGDEGINLVCQLYQISLADHKDSLLQPAPGQLLEALLDVMDNSERQIYTRVLALKLLGRLSQKFSSISSTQWLRAPNGLHRLADMLSLGVDNPVEEVVRNQALAVAHILAKEAPVSKVFLFAEVECKLFDVCWQQGGLTKGNRIVVDALGLIQEMLKHADGPLQDLVWQRPSVPSRLAQLMDLRGADEFLHPENHKTKKTSINKSATATTEDDNDDDLDTLLQRGGNKQKPTAPGENKAPEMDDIYVPHLSEAEEVVVENVIQILHLLLESESLRPEVWKQHSGMCSLVWELALVNPANPPLCAMPSAFLQQKALELIALKFNDLQTMDRHAGLDRLLFLVCTGGGNAKSYQEKMGTSQAALAVLRKVLNGDRIHKLLLHTLAPPPEGEGNPPGPTVVQKLWNTVVENLSTSESTDDPKTRSIFLSGALGGLSLMLFDEQSREMMSRVVPEAANADVMLEALQTEADSVVQWTLLRFLCEWVMDTPLMVQKLLSSTASTYLAPMAASWDKDYVPLVHLLLGLAMEYLRGDEQECGGWTRGGILQVIQKVGISRYTSSLEGLKKAQNGDLPCFASNLEYSHWAKWYNEAVWVVRKRVVRELAGENLGEDSEGDDEQGSESKSASTSAASKPLQKMIARQSEEMEGLHLELEKAKIKITSQENQLDTWKRRMESTPTELDVLLSDMTVKTASLEETVATLEAATRHDKIRHEEELNALKSQIADVRQEADESRSFAQEAKEDKERMEQELSALSQAYSSLEDDFRMESKANRRLPSAGTSTGELGQQHQPEGEMSQQKPSAGSTEVATLRAENDRLRNDARAADEWMKMAVTKMNEMGVHSSGLEQQLDTLKSQLELLHRQEAEAQREQAKQELEVLERKGDELREQVSKLEAQLQQEQVLRQNAETKAATGDDNFLSQLESERSIAQELQFKLSEAEEERRIAFEEKFTLEQKLAEELERASAVVAKDKDLPTTTHMQTAHVAAEQQITSPNVAQGETFAQLEAVRAEMMRNRDRFEEDIYKKESRIRELEDRLSSGLGSFKIEDIRTRDEEIEELRAANEAAQEWMSKAVEHHHLLSSQVATLSEEKVSLSGRLESLEREFAPSSTNDENVEKLVTVIKKKSEFIEEIQFELKKNKEELAQLLAERGRTKGLEQDLEIVRDEMAILQKQLAASQETIKSLEEKISENSIHTENENLKLSNAELQARLEEFQSWADMAQKKISEILAEKESGEKLVSELTTKYDVLVVENSALSERLELKDTELAMLRKNLEESVYSRTAGMKDEDDESGIVSGDKIAGLEIDYEALRAENGRLSEQLEMNDLEIERLETIKALNSNSNGEASRNEDTDSEANGEMVQQQVRQLTEELRVAQDNLGAEADVVRQWEVRVEELEAELLSLNSQMQEQEEEATTAIAQWQESYTETDGRCSELERNFELLRDEKVALEKSLELARQKPEALHEEKSSLEEAIDEKHEETNDGLKTRSPNSKDETDIVSKLREELEEAQNTIAGDEDVVHQWEDRVSELESTIDSLEAQLEDQEQEATNVISQWQASFSEADDKCTLLEQVLESTRAEFRRMKEAAVIADAQASDDGTMQAWEETVAALQTEIEMLKKTLQDEQTSFRETIEKLEEKSSASAQMYQKLQNEVQTMANEEVQAEALETEIEDLQKSLLDHKRSANDTIEKLEEMYSASEVRCQKFQQEADRRTQVEIQMRTALEMQLKEQGGNALNALSEKDALEKSVLQLKQEKLSLENILQEQQGIKVDESSNEVLQQLRQSEEAHSETLREWERAKEELKEAREVLANDEEVIGKWKERVAELDSSVRSLECQLAEQEEEANTAIGQWQNRSSELEVKLSNVEAELLSSRDELASRDGAIAKLQGLDDELAARQEAWRDEADKLKIELAEEKGRHHEARDEIAALKMSVNELEDGTNSLEIRWRERVVELKSAIESLEVQSQEHAGETERVITELQMKCSNVEATVSSLQTELNARDKALAAKDGAIEDCQADIDMYRKEIEALKETNAIDTAKTELAASRAENELLNDKLTVEQAGRVREAEKYEGELATEKLRYQEARDEIEALTLSFDELRSESENVVNQWTDRVGELEKTVDQLQQQLQQQEEEANEAISSWESKALEFEKDLESSVRELEDMREMTVKVLEEEAGNLETKLRDLETELRRTIEDRDRLRDMIASKSTERLEEERDRLTVVVGQLEEELRLANDVIQTYVTDEAAEKATEIASNALRDELNDLKYDIDHYKHQIESEKSAREVAELEIERLRDDVATLAALTNPGGKPGDLQLRTVQAAEKLKRKERIEIEELRNSLYRALDDVEIARGAEREAIQNLAKIRLQTSVCEQEIVAAKSEIHFLTQALEDLHQGEENKRASLEYRIGSLEDENDLLRKYHAGELEDVQHELSQVTMEKDRTVHQLRELERTNAALVYASSKEETEDSKDSNDPEGDIAKLRVANAHLLTVAADDKARAERKLRESLAAQMASTEADAILEHELRVNAEETIRSLKFQIEELKKARSRQTEEGASSSMVQKTSDSTTKKIESLHQDLKKVQKEKANLQIQMETEAAEAKAHIDKLTEECRKAQSKLHKAERDGRFDAAVKSEVTRLRMSPMASTPEARDDVFLLKAEVESNGTSSNAAAFDLIRKHKEEIQEERKMYLEFLAEHDNLLALLAQQDVERICLREELSGAGGQVAVERALLRAEQKTMSQFGKIIKLAQSP